MASAHYTNQEETQLIEFFTLLQQEEKASAKVLLRLQKKFTQDGGGFWSKTELTAAYHSLAGTHGLQPVRSDISQLLQMKPTRTISGVAPVTVLTKPFPCPGRCIFCPSDVRMPKSYLSDEPGAQRAEKNYFDPYLQTYNRVSALAQMGHSVNKIELIILGGTWSYYPEAYQVWFITECFRALNDFGVIDHSINIRGIYQNAEKLSFDAHQIVRSDDQKKNKIEVADYEMIGGQSKNNAATYNQTVSEMYVQPEKKTGLTEYQSASWEELEQQQLQNETTLCRCVGLVIETRPDNISVQEVLRIRRLGCTKTQIGVQSLQDSVLSKNNRGHDVAATQRAFALLRQAGFKIHAHWMPNLYGSSPEADIEDYKKLFADPRFCPDELKIYPCSLIESAELLNYYKQGLWRPYSEEELLHVLTLCFQLTPSYCRLTRVIRDIPSTDILVGNKKTNFRQLVDQWLEKNHRVITEIRSREIRHHEYDAATAKFSTIQYTTTVSQEQFLQFTAPVAGEEKLLAFLRLSLPNTTFDPIANELEGAAMIREIHVYGQATGIGHHEQGRSQHVGLGRRLLAKAALIAQKAGYQKLAVISAIGTKEYYRSLGFTDGQLYQHLDLQNLSEKLTVLATDTEIYEQK